MYSGDDLRLPFELNDESDFERIISPDGLLTICGFGSLLSERSARSTFPELINFRVARLNGFRRIFAHVAPVFFDRGIANPQTKEMSSLSVEPCEGETLIVTVFGIKKSEVLPETLDGKLFTSPAWCAFKCFVHVLVTRNISKLDAKEVKKSIFSDMDNITFTRSGVMISYLAVFIFGTAKNLGDEAYNNFLDHTFLGDRKTTIREYLVTTGSGIMEEEPLESIKAIYSG
ncbi:hypothetical protein CsSME_00033121 [Camellia sinensis var. sinensis]